MSEALRLADYLDHKDFLLSVKHIMDAAEELRRLHDLLGKANALCRIRADRIKKLEALNAELVEALRRCRDMVAHPDNLAFIDAALAKVEASK